MLKVAHRRYFKGEKECGNYYPFGMEWDTPTQDQNGNSLQPTGVESKYTYNGKEFLDDLDINLHDFGFRYYDPAIGRFIGIDPIAEDFAHVSTYNYAENEPIANIDLWGLQAVNSTAASFHSGEGAKFAKSHPKTAAVIAAAPAAGLAAGAGAVGVGLAALRSAASSAASTISSGLSSMASSLGGMMKAAPAALETGAKSLFLGSMSERATAVGIDITSQVVVNAATGSDFNLASTASAALMPNAYLTQGFVAGAVELNVTEREGGGNKIEPGFSLKKGLVGGAFGKLGGELGNGIGKALNNTSGNGGVSMASLLKNLPSLVTTSSREVVNEGIK